MVVMLGSPRNIRVYQTVLVVDWIMVDWAAVVVYFSLKMSCAAASLTKSAHAFNRAIFAARLGP